ncbi:hypothetical protein [Alicyclobacillus ferrooxydans]|uniref:hypothetical protein n=1 Tax=Alicyclobacillus ferrooxydans TaxID=471514 RepID=UPI0006D55937|nr:hypothetical protein [Alicyclobacillus ferrooxydans]
MNRRNIVSITEKATVYVRWAIVTIMLVILVWGIIGFLVKWGGIVVHPQSILASFRAIINDLFSILLVYELLDLLRTLSPHRLMDFVLLVLARKIVLSTGDVYLLTDIIAFSILILVRLIWRRFSKPPNTAHQDNFPNDEHSSDESS